MEEEVGLGLARTHIEKPLSEHIYLSLFSYIELVSLFSFDCINLISEAYLISLATYIFSQTEPREKYKLRVAH